jgi:hypothetical protein
MVRRTWRDFTKLSDIDHGQDDDSTFRQWVDDVEIWQGGIPTASLSCQSGEVDLGQGACNAGESCCCE